MKRIRIKTVSAGAQRVSMVFPKVKNYNFSAFRSAFTSSVRASSSQAVWTAEFAAAQPAQTQNFS